jgi:diacylglycerol kinase (ATP)
MRASRPRALLLISAQSRTGADVLEAAKERLDALGIEPFHRDCPDRKDLSATIVCEGRNADLVVVGGGDGTISAAAQGVITLDKPLGILPTGTANDLARISHQGGVHRGSE